MGFNEEQLFRTLDKTKITETRFTEVEVSGIKIVKLMAKGNNSIPVSLVFDYIKKKKEIRSLF